MHEAYEVTTVVDKLPLNVQIESIASYSDTLLIGTKSGLLLIFTVKTTDGKAEVQLHRTVKGFAKKAIFQLAVIPEFHILISLADGNVNVSELTVITRLTSVSRAAGASLFAVDVQKLPGGDNEYNLRLCVAVKRKIQMYYWKNRDFHELLSDITVPEQPKTLVICGSYLLIGFRNDYMLFKMDSGQTRELFPTGKSEPVGIRLSDGRLGVGKDDLTVFFNCDEFWLSQTDTLHKAIAFKWNDVPKVLVHQSPYLIALLPMCVEIRTIEPRHLIQSIDISRAQCVSLTSDAIYVASEGTVWRLSQTNIRIQMQQLLRSKQFELALRIANSMEGTMDKMRQEYIEQIHTLQAFHLFMEHRFTESLQLFSVLRTDPSHVIGLFPGLLPAKFRQQIIYPEKVPDLDGADLEKGLLALTEYLTQKRSEVLKDLQWSAMTSVPLVAGEEKDNKTIIKSRKQIIHIIDTTLLKCYLETNDALVAPLLRLKENYCHLDESEKALKQRHKYVELIILYERKGLHKQALDFLKNQACIDNSPIRGLDMTIEYLERLGPAHQKLIFEYSQWVLMADPKKGLKIFVDDMPEVESLNRNDVLEFLQRVQPSLVVPYLEHVTEEWKDKTEKFHTLLAKQYMDNVRALQAEQNSSLAQEENEKLLLFLEKSDHYSPEQLLASIQISEFYEERAVLLGRLGDHEKALAIYTSHVRDRTKAEEYCKRHYDPSKEPNKDIFLILLRLYVAKPDPNNLLVPRDIQPNTDAALHLLNAYPDKINMAKAVDLLPTEVKLTDVRQFIVSFLQRMELRRLDNVVVKRLYFSDNLQARLQKMELERVKVMVSEDKVCSSCRKKIGNSAFAQYPNGQMAHYFCFKDVPS